MWSGRQRLRDHFCKSCRAAHFLELAGRVRITLRRRTKHLKCEHGREARRHPVLIWQKLDSHSAPSGDEALASLPKKGHAGVAVELVEEVGQQHQIEAAAPV